MSTCHHRALHYYLIGYYNCPHTLRRANRTEQADQYLRRVFVLVRAMNQYEDSSAVVLCNEETVKSMKNWLRNQEHNCGRWREQQLPLTQHHVLAVKRHYTTSNTASSSLFLSNCVGYHYVYYYYKELETYCCAFTCQTATICLHFLFFRVFQKRLIKGRRDKSQCSICNQQIQSSCLNLNRKYYRLFL